MWIKILGIKLEIMELAKNLTQTSIVEKTHEIPQSAFELVLRTGRFLVTLDHLPDYI